jgi:hypothetical protein
MARIYESQGPRARLRGPQTTPGFQPVQAVDTSRQTLTAGQEAVQDYARVRRLQEESALDARRVQEQQVLDARRVSENSALSVRKFQLEEFARVGQVALDNASRDLEALSQFSNSLNKFLFERAQAQNEKDMKLEMAKVLNGDLTVQPNVREEFNVLKDRLADAALTEANLSDFIADNISNIVAEEHRATSPALKGWRAYGNALGRVKKAAAMAQNLISDFMESAEQTVPIPNEDGTQRVIAPRDAKTPSELMAALAVGEQLFISSAQLNAINPILISEHLTPQIMAIRESIVANRTASARKEAQLEAIEKVHERIGAEVTLLDPQNPGQIQQFWQETTKDLQINGRMGRGEANEAVVKSFIAHARSLGGLPGSNLLTALATTPLIADQPNGPTVGDRFRPLFEEAARSIESYEDAMRAKAEKAQDDMVDDLISAHQLLLTTQGVTADQISSSWSTTTEQLRQLAAQGSRRAINELSTMIQQGENYNPFLAADLARDIASGRMPNPAEIDELVRLGRITATEANDLKNRLPSSAAVEKAKAIRPEIQRLVRGIYADTLAQQGINATDAGSATALLEGQMTDELEELAQAWASQNPDGSPAELRDFLRQRAEALGKQPRFTPEIVDGVVRPKAGLNQSSNVVRFLNPVTGNQTRDFTRANPAQVQTSRPVTRADFLINSQELAQNTQAFIQGGQPTPRVRALMTATGKDWQTFLRDQSNAYGIPFTNLSQSQAAQAAAQRRQLAPAAAAILTNPNATAQQRVRAWNDINAARQRTSQRQQALSGEAAGKTEGVGGLLSLIRSGEGSWTSVNRGVAGDTPGGMPNLTSMSIGEIERLQESRQVFAVGAYQFTPGVLARARREAGLSPNEPFTPQNQNLMGVALLTGTKRPKLAAYLRGESDDLRAAHLEISMEWAALQGPNGRGYYDGDKAGNRASIPAQQVQQMLIQARRAISGR